MKIEMLVPRSYLSEIFKLYLNNNYCASYYIETFLQSSVEILDG